MSCKCSFELNDVVLKLCLGYLHFYQEYFFLIVMGNFSFFFHVYVPTIKAVQGTMKTSPQSLDDYQIVNNSTSYEDTNEEKEMEETMINDEFSTTTNLSPPR